MATRLPPLRAVPIGFAHRGGKAHAPENTLDAFRLALRLGATGLESDAWLTADGHVALDHDGIVGRLRRRAFAALERHRLPGHVPTLDELYATCGTGFELSLDVKDPAAAPAIVETARRAGGGALGRLWLCHPDWRTVASWRSLAPEIRLVDSTRLRRIKEGPERRAATLAEVGIDAVNLHHTDWTGGLTTLFHRFGRYCLGWDAQYERALVQLLDMGIDGVFSDHVDRMVDALQAAHGD
ncbi:MAG: glycerophosphodiester phosphodiesterase [Acidimicrobiales bacterium]|nr:glycerophosphodiester phosphodiesterase [Acidimicrobiales bacterium]MCB1014319.1 glycerophosphodiester phosphodiesterase [Acidimicrobiales bacterium]